MRIVAMVAVVAIHTTTRQLEVAGYDFYRAPGAIFLNQVLRFAVPLFFMISGYVLEISYIDAESYGQFLKKRISRLLIPYLIWSAIYYFLVYKQHTMGFLAALVGGSASYQLYFVPSLIIFYIIFPIIHKNRHWLVKKWVFPLLLATQIVILERDYRGVPINLPYPWLICLFNFFVFGLGVAAVHHQQKIEGIVEKWRYLFLSITLFGAGHVVYEGISGYMATKNYLAFYSQWRPSVLVYTTYLAATMYYYLSKTTISEELIKKISSLSLLVFFIHVLVIEVVWQWVPGNLLFPITTGISFTAAYLVSKVPRVATLLG